MTPDDLKKMEQTIAASFIRGGVLKIQDAKDHAALAVTHMRKALSESNKGDSL